MPTYECEKFIQPPAVVCGTNHCSKLMKTSPAIEYCECKTWDGKQIPGCGKKSATVPYPTNECYLKVPPYTKKDISFDDCLDLIFKDKNWTWRVCYCCCSCYAWYTRIAVSQDAVKYVQNFQENDEVYAASLNMQDGKLALVWETLNVAFSGGTSPKDTAQEMMVIQYGETGSITVTSDQIFLLPDGTLSTAEKLTPGQYLVTDSGDPVLIIGVYLGNFTGGIHHLATSLESEEEVDVDGHLLSTNGIVTGDFYLQVHAGSQKVASRFTAGFDGLPSFGSEQYREKAGIQAGIFSATLAGSDARSPRSIFFRPYEEPLPDEIPASWRRYITDEQAEVLKKAPHAPVSEEVNKANFLYIRSLFSGFFPDIEIILDWPNETPNLYAYIENDEKIIRITGRLLRTRGLRREGLAMILAHGIGRFLGTAVKDADGFACTGQADFFGASYVLINAFYFDWSTIATQGYLQVGELFSLLGPQIEPGDNKCSTPALKCRLEALSNAISSRDLPECAGAPKPGALALESAEAAVVEGQTSVIAVFNLPVNQSSAENLENYWIVPDLEITTATLQTDAPNRVVLTVTLPEDPEGEYTLKVQDIYSEDGSTLNKKMRQADFTIEQGIATAR